MTDAVNRLVLVYPPYATANAPPMGVFFLKGFIQRTLADWTVDVLDLNLLAHQELFAEIDAKVCQAAAEQLPQRVLSEVALSRAAEVFRGKHPHEFYDRPDRYFLYSGLWGQTVQPRLADHARLEKVFRRELPMPESIRSHAKLVVERQPAMVGISICYTEQLFNGLCLAREIRR